MEEKQDDKEKDNRGKGQVESRRRQPDENEEKEIDHHDRQKQQGPDERASEGEVSDEREPDEAKEGGEETEKGEEIEGAAGEAAEADETLRSSEAGKEVNDAEVEVDAVEENQVDKENHNSGREQKEESRTRVRQDEKEKENDHLDGQKQQEGERANEGSIGFGASEEIKAVSEPERETGRPSEDKDQGRSGESETLRGDEAGKGVEMGGAGEASRNPSLSRHTKARRLTCFGPLFKRFSPQAPLHGLSPARLETDPIWDFLPKDSGLSSQDLEKAERRHSRSLSQPERTKGKSKPKEGGEETERDKENSRKEGEELGGVGEGEVQGGHGEQDDRGREQVESMSKKDES